MKKIVSISLLLVFLFNMLGYKLFFIYLEKAADRRIEASLDMLSDMDKRLVKVKIPINLPYHTNWKDFERVDGSVSFRGNTYKYVKRKVYQDTLILLCIDHKERSDIQKSSEDYLKKVNNLTAETGKKSPLKQVKADYYEEISSFGFEQYIRYITCFNCFSKDNCLPGFVRDMEIPPDVLFTMS